MFKELSDMEKPRTWNNKVWRWCSIKTVEKYAPWKFCCHPPFKCTRSDRKRRGCESSQSGGNNIKLERSMAALISLEVNPDDQEYDEERK